jgi:hypothetical protein
MLAAIAATPVAAEEPVRPKAVPSVKTAGERAREKAETEHEAMLDRVEEVRKLLEDDRWLQELANKAATKGVTEWPKLPSGVSVTIKRGVPRDNPFGNPFADQSSHPGRAMQAVASKTAQGPRGTVTVRVWCDTRKIDVSKLR